MFMLKTAPRKAIHTRAILLAVTTALATTALSGCATKGAATTTASANQAEQAGSLAVRGAEQAVLAAPRNSQNRALLGAAYMEAGRFKAAATGLKDAIALGDNSPRTVLSYALAEIATGNNAAALAVLDKWENNIDPADLGLALSLAGQPRRGVRVLSTALRSGQTTAKLRQNLAYSYALQGDWRSARLMAAEDVHPDKIDDRIGEWAQTINPAAFQQRVANLLGVPVVWDAGQPSELALNITIDAEQLATETSALSPRQADVAVADQKQWPAQSGELMPVTDRSPMAEPVKRANADEISPKVQAERFKQAFAGKTVTGATVAQVTEKAVKLVSAPAVQKTPARLADKAAPAHVADNELGSEDYLIQLGSFSSEAGAKRAWGIYAKGLPQLSQYKMIITRARVRGKNYYRVSAGVFGQRARANSMCSTVRTSGNGCITWAAIHPLPGALGRGVRM